MTLADLAVWATIGAFLVPLCVLAFSAHRWLNMRDSEAKSARFLTYHNMIHAISSGTNERGIMKLTSQVAYIYELRNFPEYARLSDNILNLLRKDWSEKEKDEGERRTSLLSAIDETLAELHSKM